MSSARLFKDQAMYNDNINPTMYRNMGATSYAAPFYQPRSEDDFGTKVF